MESQPQNPEFRNNPENFTHALCKSQRETADSKFKLRAQTDFMVQNFRKSQHLKT